MITSNPCKLELLVEFAEKGGIGTCVASQDVIAHSEIDLMFYTGEVITVLKHIKDDIYLGYCEGVIGIFRGKTVEFNGSLRDLKSIKSENQVDDDQYSPEQSPKQASFLQPLDTPSSLSDNTNSGSSDMEDIPQSSPPLPNQNNVPISQRESSISSEHSYSSDESNYSQSSQNQVEQVEHDQVNNDQYSPEQSPKQASFLQPLDTPSSLSDNTNSESSDVENIPQSSPPSPNQNNVPISQQESFISSEHSYSSNESNYSQSSQNQVEQVEHDQVNDNQYSPEKSPKQASFLQPLDTPSSLSDDTNSESSDMENIPQSSPPSPNQNNVPISQQESSISSEHSYSSDESNYNQNRVEHEM